LKYKLKRSSRLDKILGLNKSQKEDSKLRRGAYLRALDQTYFSF
jgi:hypothetical protein